MKFATFFDAIRHEPTKWLAIGCIFIASTLLGLEILQAFKVDFDIKTAGFPPKIQKMTTINEQSLALVWPLFGVYLPDNLSNIKQSTLDLEVVGILYSKKENDSQVIIRSANGEDAAYAEGDTLPSGVVIKRINKQGIVVLHEGRLERLNLQKKELIFAPPPKPLIKE